MKHIKKTLLLSTFLCTLIFIFLPNHALAQEFYQCEISVEITEGVDYGSSGNIHWIKPGMETCHAMRNQKHMCQIYDYSLTSNQMLEYCKTTCLKRSNYPKNCVSIKVAPSTNIDAHQGKKLVDSDSKIAKLFKEFFGKDDTEKNQDQNYEVAAILAKDTQNENKDNTVSQKECLRGEVYKNGECVYRCEFDEKWNGKECIPDKELGPNEYETTYNSKDEKVIKFVDVYGNEKYTKDGKYFYDSYGQAATNNPIRNAWHGVTEKITGIKDFFFKTKLKDKDKELQREIAREVLSDFKSKKEKDREKAIGKLESKIAGLANNVVPKPMQDLVSVPADSVKDFAKEAKETEFAEGVMIYIKERELGSTSNTLYTNTPEELEYGGIGGGVAAGLNSEYPKALLFAKYEESYQRYKIAKELNRTE